MREYKFEDIFKFAVNIEEQGNIFYKTVAEEKFSIPKALQRYTSLNPNQKIQ